MSPRIFISHASPDRRIAERICQALEQRDLACWISSRDIRPGEAFADAIVRAIVESKVMLLVFSTNANNSGEVLKELALASKQRLVVIPVRVEDVVPSGPFEYELATRQWLDLLDDWDAGMAQLAGRIAPIVAPESAVPADMPAARPAILRLARRWRWLAPSLGAIGAVTVLFWPWSSELPDGAFRDCPECPEMLHVPAGSFTMGASPEEEERERTPDNTKGNSVPLRPVSVRAFALAKYEVTQAEFAVFVEATGFRPGEGCVTWEENQRTLRANRNWRSPGYTAGESDPVTCLSWDDARAYVAWLSRRTGKTYRLPAEAEWEYAARAGTQTPRYWGDRIGTAMANCDGCRSQWDRRKAAPVGSFPANGFGLKDMLGNVWEWVEDCWNNTFAEAPSDGSAWTTGSCGRRPVRGGGWLSAPESVRAARRLRLDPGLRSDILGFRVARDE